MWQKILEKLLLRLYGHKTDFFLKKWNRSLPLTEMIVNRWDRAKRLGFGEGASIYDNSLVLGDVHVGKGTWIGPFTVLDGSGGRLSIGDYCSISAGVQIYTHNSVRWAVSGGKSEFEKAPVSIGNCVYIGPNTIIAKGMTVGYHCVIGANSYLESFDLRPVPDFSIIVGSPAKVVGVVKMRKKGKIDFE